MTAYAVGGKDSANFEKMKKERESDINGLQITEFDRRGVSRNNEPMSEQEQRRNPTNFENTQGQNISSGICQSNVSEKTIEQEYKDIKAIRNTIDYANKHQIKK